MQTVKHTPTIIKKGDMVQVIAGRERGKTGKVTSVLRERNRVLIEGLNTVKRATKPSQKNPQGGMVEKASPLHYSNILLLCPKCNRGVRVGTQAKGDKKTRACKKCGTEI